MTQKTNKNIRQLFATNKYLHHVVILGAVAIFCTTVISVGMIAFPFFLLGSILVITFFYLKRDTSKHDIISNISDVDYFSVLFDTEVKELVFQSPSIKKILGERPDTLESLMGTTVFSFSDRKLILSLLAKNSDAEVKLISNSVCGSLIKINVKKMYHKYKTMVIFDFTFVDNQEKSSIKPGMDSDGSTAEPRQIIGHKIRKPQTTNIVLPKLSQMNYKFDLKNDTEIIEHLLTSSPFHAHYLNVQELDMNVIVKDVCNDFKELIDETSTILSISNLPSVSADAVQLTHLIKLLFKNALLYNTNYNPKIIFDCKAMDDELIFCIKDNGSGISEGNRSKIFTPYYRCEDNNDSIPGIGLGLSIGKYIINNHKGSIWYECNEISGSCFYFSLPFPLAIPLKRKSEDNSQVQYGTAN